MRFPDPANGINWTYGGACPLGYSVRATLVITQNRDCIPEQRELILPCVDNGSGTGQWSYESISSESRNGMANNTNINFIFDVYNSENQTINESFEPIGRQWSNGSPSQNAQAY